MTLVARLLIDFALAEARICCILSIILSPGSNIFAMIISKLSYRKLSAMTIAILFQMSRFGVIEDIITNTLLDDPSCNTDCYSILLDLLFAFLEGSRGLLGVFFNEIPYVFLYKYGSHQVGLSWPVGKAFKLLLSQSIEGIIVSVFVHRVFLIGTQVLDNY